VTSCLGPARNEPEVIVVHATILDTQYLAVPRQQLGEVPLRPVIGESLEGVKR
jgi:hypothetical protein